MELLTFALGALALVGVYLYVNVARRLRRVEEELDRRIASDSGPEG